MNSGDIDTLLQSWDDTKKEIAVLESRLERYKKAAERIMRKNNDNTIEGSHFTLTKRVINRETLGKNDVPREIWRQYAKACSYLAYFLSKSK